MSLLRLIALHPMSWAPHQACRAVVMAWMLALVPVSAAVSQPRLSWILPESVDPAVHEAIAAFMADDIGRGLRALQTSPGEASDNDPTLAARHYLRALMLAAIGRHVDALDATDKGLRSLAQRNSRDYVRLVLLRSSLLVRAGKLIATVGLVIQAPPVAQEVFGDSHPATTFARVLEAMVSADAFQRPQSLDIALAKLATARSRLSPLTAQQPPEHGGEDFISRALLAQGVGQMELQKRNFEGARRAFDVALVTLRAALPEPSPTRDTLRLTGIFIGLDEDRLLGHAATAAAYAKDDQGAQRLATASIQRALQLAGLPRATWTIGALMTGARALGDCEAVERLLAPAGPGRDANQVRALQLREIGACWTVTAKDPARAQSYFDEAKECSSGGERCGR